MPRFVITGYSHKRDGFCWTTEATNQDEAVQKLLAVIASPEEQGEPYKVVEGDYNTYLLKADFDGDVNDFEDDVPRWEGWAVYFSEVAESGFASGCVCW